MSPRYDDFLRECFPWIEINNNKFSGFRCNDGWFNLVRQLLGDIDSAYKNVNRQCDIFNSFLGEKFGKLQVDYSHSDDTSLEDCWHSVEYFINEAAHESIYTCECCGKAGRFRKDLGYVQTLCDSCYEKAIEYQRMIK